MIAQGRHLAKTTGETEEEQVHDIMSLRGVFQQSSISHRISFSANASSHTVSE